MNLIGLLTLELRIIAEIVPEAGITPTFKLT